MSRDVEEALRLRIAAVPADEEANTALVVHLIASSRYRAADAEWRAALARIRRARALGHHDAAMCLAVAEAWLARSEVARARSVFSELPPPDGTSELGHAARMFAHRLGDAEEAMLLGESVYPQAVPLAQRWVAPRLLPPTNLKGFGLREWFPGRVVERTNAGVLLVVATPATTPSARMVVEKEVTLGEWRLAAGCAPSPADTYLEVGTYEDDALCILVDLKHPGSP
ncbi:hypothetical protein OWM54_42905 [Myxococcus sp. MISCRS1]|uniref:hypothetical protein n=1 Tax=Myxococcus sp. MISCRS1 TaxID=2996786 RepID=UPI002271B118|nr:hypothetical protein [Myxococcus sp. MISCRS1]MCY1003915.1 hypothetical protein [Myxococcus sp. MISCRS1]